jgi:hypothetical protein
VVFTIRAYDVAGREHAEQIWKDPRSKFTTDAEGRQLVLWPPNGREYLTFEELSQKQGRALARDELPFLFKAFELGQKAPPRPGTRRAELPRAATIHEYLDWTVTASEPQDPDELDFGGFRVLLLMPRFRLQWPPPNAPYVHPQPLKYPQLGAPLPPIPHLMVHNKPICAATVRLGPDWLEVPFYATQESRRNKGIGRALLECIEDVGRFLNISRILLCSTDDARVKNTWRRLGLYFTNKEYLETWGVTRHDLLHMDNTVQMHKDVPPQRPWKPMTLKHGDYVHRLYYLPGGGNAPPLPTNLLAKLNGPRKMGGGVKKLSKPPKKRVRKR